MGGQLSHRSGREVVAVENVYHCLPEHKGTRYDHGNRSLYSLVAACGEVHSEEDD